MPKLVCSSSVLQVKKAQDWKINEFVLTSKLQTKTTFNTASLKVTLPHGELIHGSVSKHKSGRQHKKEAVPSYAWDDSMREIQVMGDIL